MSMDKIVAFFDELEKNDNVKKLAQGKPMPETREGIISGFVEVANEFGYELSKSDFLEFIDWKKSELRRKIDADADYIQRLDDDEMDQIAAGFSLEALYAKLFF